MWKFTISTIWSRTISSITFRTSIGGSAISPETNIIYLYSLLVISNIVNRADFIPNVAYRSIALSKAMISKSFLCKLEEIAISTDLLDFLFEF